MSLHEPHGPPTDPKELAAWMNKHWQPSSPDPNRFETQLWARKRYQRRRKQIAGASTLLLAAVALFVVNQATQIPETAPPHDTSVATLQATTADSTADQLWWGEALNSDASQAALPGEYEALSELFIELF